MTPCVIDTMVIRKSNAPITKAPHADRLFTKRLQLIKGILASGRRILWSPRLLREYGEQVKTPRNLWIEAYLAYLSGPSAGAGRN